jgi:hypothetical protein
MRQFDLQHAFFGGGAATENLENETGAVDDLDLPFASRDCVAVPESAGDRRSQAAIRSVDQRLDLQHLALCRKASTAGDRKSARSSASATFKVDGAGEADSLFPAMGVGPLEHVRAVRATAGRSIARAQRRHKHNGTLDAGLARPRR